MGTGRGGGEGWGTGSCRSKYMRTRLGALDIRCTTRDAEEKVLRLKDLQTGFLTVHCDEECSTVTMGLRGTLSRAGLMEDQPDGYH